MAVYSVNRRALNRKLYRESLQAVLWPRKDVMKKKA
jgi:hypothetical protein